MVSSAANYHGNVREIQCLESGHPEIMSEFSVVLLQMMMTEFFGS